MTTESQPQQECKCEPEHGFAWNPDCPTHGDQQEWTPQRVASYLTPDYAERLSADINAAIAAERQRRECPSCIFYAKAGITLLDAKWLDPECHEGCQSLKFKKELPSETQPSPGSWKIEPVRRESGEVWIGLAYINTGKGLCGSINLQVAESVVAAHESELVSERQRREQSESQCKLLVRELTTVKQQLLSAQAAIDEARAQRDWLIKECARVGVTVNVQIGAPITEAYRLVNNAAEVRKPLVEVLNLLLDSVDYTIGNCTVNNCVGAVLDRVIIDKSRDALAKVKDGK